MNATGRGLSPDASCRYAGTLTMLAVYGYRVTSNDDPYLQLAEDLNKLIADDIVAVVPAFGLST